MVAEGVTNGAASNFTFDAADARHVRVVKKSSGIIGFSEVDFLGKATCDGPAREFIRPGTMLSAPILDNLKQRLNRGEHTAGIRMGRLQQLFPRNPYTPHPVRKYISYTGPGERISNKELRADGEAAYTNAFMFRLTGDGALWGFGTGWKNLLGIPGVVDMGHIKTLLLDSEWWRFVPSPQIISANAGTRATRKIALRVGQDERNLAYYPDVSTATISPSVAIGGGYHWFDLNTGTTRAGGSVEAPMALKPPTDIKDAVLILGEHSTETRGPVAHRACPVTARPSRRLRLHMAGEPSASALTLQGRRVASGGREPALRYRADERPRRCAARHIRRIRSGQRSVGRL